jgi:CRP-like cAMP-binding protein
MKRKGKLPFDPRAFLSKVNGGRTIADYRKDEIVFSQGGVADAVFYIQKGKIKLSVISERGKEAVVGILGPGHFFGEGCLNGHRLRVTTATAIDQCLITRIPKAAGAQKHSCRLLIHVPCARCSRRFGRTTSNGRGGRPISSGGRENSPCSLCSA